MGVQLSRLAPHNVATLIGYKLCCVCVLVCVCMCVCVCWIVNGHCAMTVLEGSNPSRLWAQYCSTIFGRMLDLTSVRLSSSGPVQVLWLIVTQCAVKTPNTKKLFLLAFFKCFDVRLQGQILVIINRLGPRDPTKAALFLGCTQHLRPSENPSLCYVRCYYY